MGVRVVFGMNALVLLIAGALCFIPSNTEVVFAVSATERVALLVATGLGAIVHVVALLRKHRATSPAILVLPLLLPALCGLAVGVVRARDAAQALTGDMSNRALQASVLWFGGSQVATGLGFGAWISGMLMLSAAVGAAALVVARGGFEASRSMQQRLALGLAWVVCSALIRFWGEQTLLPSNVVTWGSVLGTVAILLLGTRSTNRRPSGWQPTLLTTISYLLPLGVVLTTLGWRGLQVGHLVDLLVEKGTSDRLEALASPVRTVDGVVSGLTLAASAFTAWACLPKAETSRRGRLGLICTLIVLVGVTLSLTNLQSQRAAELERWARHALGGGEVAVPVVAGGQDTWVPDVPAIIVPDRGIPRLVKGPGPDETVDLSLEAVSDLSTSHPPPSRPPRSVDNQEGGCGVGRELPGIRMPGALLVVDWAVTLQHLSAQLGPLNAHQSRVYGALTARPGSEATRVLPTPWRSLSRLASTGATLLRVESSVQRAIRLLPGSQPDRYIAQPERDGLRVVSYSGTAISFDKVVRLDDEEPIGRCFFGVGCNAVPCEFMIAFPPSWTFERIMRLVSIVDPGRHSDGMDAYRAHHMITLTPDVQGMGAVIRDTRSRMSGKAKGRQER